MNQKRTWVQTIALAVSVLVLIGSFGIQTDIHLCKDEIKTFSILGTAEGCETVDQLSACTPTPLPHATVQRKGCCSHVSIYEKAAFPSEIPTNVSVVNLVLGANPFVTHRIIPTFLPSSRWKKETPPDPRVLTSLTVDYQVFLI